MKAELDWIVIGGGITGISISEILCRNGKSVKLVEKENKLSPKTTREFHEWVHTGSLYSIKKNQDEIQKTMLGAIDDLMFYYSAFNRMNVKPSSKGLKIIAWPNFRGSVFLLPIKFRTVGPLTKPIFCSFCIISNDSFCSM